MDFDEDKNMICIGDYRTKKYNFSYRNIYQYMKVLIRCDGVDIHHIPCTMLVRKTNHICNPVQILVNLNKKNYLKVFLVQRTVYLVGSLNFLLECVRK